MDYGNPDVETLRDAASVLRAGGLVAFPTETFYGLGAAGLSADAVRRVFEVKGRPESKPLLLLVDSVAMLDRVASRIPPAARVLMARHWPGPLTLVVPARDAVPAAVTAGTGTVGVRLPAHPVARGLVTALGEPVTAPLIGVSSGVVTASPDPVGGSLSGVTVMLTVATAESTVPSFTRKVKLSDPL